MGGLRSNLKVVKGNKFLWRIAEVLFALSLMQLLACGSYSAGNMNNTGNLMVSGTVGSVSLTSVPNGTGGMITATAVSIVVPLGTNSLVLCGDQTPSFTMNSSVQVTYTNGTYCSNLVSVKPA